MNYNTFCLWIGDTVGLVLALRYFFSPTTRFANGALNATRYPSYAIGTAVAIMTLLFASAYWTRSRIRYLPVPATAGSIGIKGMLNELRYVLRNRNYVVLLLALLFISLMIGTPNGLSFYA